MDTTTNDNNWGFAIYNEAGVDLVNFGLFTPKYIGKLHLRLRESSGSPLSNLKVVAEDGRELDINDGSLNVPFMALVAKRPVPTPEQSSGFMPGLFMFRSQNNGIRMMLPILDNSGLSLDRGSIRYGLLPAIIHGWGSGFNKEKIDMAALMCRSLKSGSDILHSHLEMKHKDGTLTEDEKANYVTGLDYSGRNYADYLPTSMPFTASFRSTSIGNNELAGFSAVSLGCGYMVIDMAGGTDLEIYFYETAGLPYEYLAKCSTSIDYNPYGLASYDYVPQTMNYVMAKKGSRAEVNDGYNRSVTFSDLVVGKVERARWFFTQDNTKYIPDSVGNIMETLKNGENTEKRKKLAKFLEGDENAPLKYEQYDSSYLPLKLMGVVGQNGGVINRRSTSAGLFYEVSGIDLNKAAQPVGILGWDYAAFYRTGLPDGFGAGVHSLFQSKVSGSSYFPMLPNPHDTFKWELDKINPYQPILNYRYSNLIADKNINDSQFDLTGWQKVKIGFANAFNSRMADNLAISYRQFNKAQAISHARYNKDVILATYKNPMSESAYYQKEIRDAEQRATQLIAQTEARLEAQAKFLEDKMEADLFESEINAFKSRMGMLEQISNLVNENPSQSWQDPFWGAWAYRHGVKLELYCGARERLPETTTPLPENWLCCRKPDI